MATLAERVTELERQEVAARRRGRAAVSRIEDLENTVDADREAYESFVGRFERLVRGLSRGRLPGRGRRRDREIPLQEELNADERDALAWLVDQRRKTRSA